MPSSAVYPPSAVSRRRDSVVQSVYPPHGRFTCRKLLPATQILCNLVASPPVFFLAISLRVPSELPDSFGESLSELRPRSHLIV
ncbi:hypothetical protein B296_00057883 [Ensete ventricosum]|uniref:Uncharacterized protein n=1 Tax=Ensete ventricosum TaxID=4639 RepID=A0A426WYA0_ENSVE|nr:hypothetical protein B296_00057883 [Ensete ventricosum]